PLSPVEVGLLLHAAKTIPVKRRMERRRRASPLFIAVPTEESLDGARRARLLNPLPRKRPGAERHIAGPPLGRRVMPLGKRPRGGGRSPGRCQAARRLAPPAGGGGGTLPRRTTSPTCCSPTRAG